jgi:hypothetical protein
VLVHEVLGHAGGDGVGVAGVQGSEVAPDGLGGRLA